MTLQQRSYGGRATRITMRRAPGMPMAKLRKSNVPEPLIARMMGQNAADQFGVELSRQRTAVG
jgi:hypothetical protein